MVDVIVTVQLKAPVALTVDPQLDTVAPAAIVDEIVLPGVKPTPERVTETELGPCVGLSVIPGVVTVNEAVALSKLPSAPLAVTVYPPAVADVIVTLHENVPVPVTVAPQPVIVAGDPMVVVTTFPGVNPVPETVTETPLGPWVGFSVMLGSVTVNVAEAWSLPPSDPVAVTV